jgi:flagellar FliJ protein
MGFQYSLESVLEYRKKVEDNKKEKFIHENNRFSEETGVMESIREHYHETLEQLSGKEAFSIQEQKNYMQYIMNLHQKMEKQKIRISDSRRRRDMARAELETAQKDRKIMENLEEKELYRFKEDIKKREEKELNEIASIGFVRRKSEKDKNG